MSSLNKVLYIIVSCLILSGCSDESSSSQKEHVWKEQTETINKAKEVEGMLLESAAATREATDKHDE